MYLTKIFAVKHYNFFSLHRVAIDLILMINPKKKTKVLSENIYFHANTLYKPLSHLVNIKANPYLLLHLHIYAKHLVQFGSKFWKNTQFLDKFSCTCCFLCIFFLFCIFFFVFFVFFSKKIPWVVVHGKIFRFHFLICERQVKIMYVIEILIPVPNLDI